MVTTMSAFSNDLTKQYFIILGRRGIGVMFVYANMHVVGMAGTGKRAEPFFFRRSIG